MRIQLDLKGELEDELSETIASNFTVAEGVTLEDMLKKLPFVDRVVLTSVNGTVIARSDRASLVLNESDKVTLLPAIKGG
ncbi:MAG: hypothetical protein DHS20C01_18360 [marine bacterium B5-7]|nr:MAG: hypothetical protein DHS20C01_18360 [marine bacterium B5-7]